MATQPPTIDPVPTPAIQRGDRATFSNRVDAFIRWLVNAVTQFGAVATNVFNNATEALQSALSAATSAANAASQANAAQAVVGVQPWTSGTNYAVNTTVISGVNAQTYRRIVAGAGTTDPANDQTNWRLLAGNDSNGAFVPIPLSGTVIDLSQGNYFTSTRGVATSFTFTNAPAGGFSFTLELTLTAAVNVAFPSSVRTPNNAGSGMQANKTNELMFVTSNGGTRWRLVTAPNFDI